LSVSPWFCTIPSNLRTLPIAASGISNIASFQCQEGVQYKPMDHDCISIYSFKGLALAENASLSSVRCNSHTIVIIIHAIVDIKNIFLNKHNAVTHTLLQIQDDGAPSKTKMYVFPKPFRNCVILLLSTYVDVLNSCFGYLHKF